MLTYQSRKIGSLSATGITLWFFLCFSLNSHAQEWQNINDILGGDSSPNQPKNSTENRKSTQPTSRENRSFADIIRKYEQAVAIVVIVAPNGDRVPMGTAWGVAPGKFATNGHISLPVEKYMTKGLTIQVQLNNSSRKIFTVTKSISHPAYNPNSGNFDIGLLHVSNTSHPIWPIADTQDLKRLAAGEDVALLGFPTERLIKGNININKPLASAQIGNIVALSDYTLKNAGFENNYAIRHSIPATGGASGSPIFTKEGKVIGLLNAGNISSNMKLEKRNGKIVPVFHRLPSAALINYGVRVDLVRDLL